jgi:hypothetical protein
MCTVYCHRVSHPLAVIKYIISCYQIKSKTLNIPVNVIEAYGRAELELHSFLISALGERAQLHTPAALLLGISDSVLNQQEAGETLSPSGGFRGEKNRLTCRKSKTTPRLYGLYCSHCLYLRVLN